MDPAEAEANHKKHDVRFSESLPAIEDDYAIAIADDASDSTERRFVSIGLDAKGRMLVVVYSLSRIIQYQHVVTMTVLVFAHGNIS